jgi:formylglycine-generating enzyme required for sulfatase activity
MTTFRTVFSLLLVGIVFIACAPVVPNAPTQKAEVALPAARSVSLPEGLSLELRLVIPGTFNMGTPETETGHKEDETLRRTTISRPLYFGLHEVTQAQYRAVLQENPAELPHRYADPRNIEPNMPVVGLRYHDAVAFCEALSRHTKLRFRLPTEAEFENACRADSHDPFGPGITADTLAEFAVYGKDARLSDPVGGKRPNARGLFDLTGNVWEWTSDWYEPTYNPKETVDPQGPAATGQRTIRGGCSFNPINSQRCGARHPVGATYKDAAIGFRVVLEP